MRTLFAGLLLAVATHASAQSLTVFSSNATKALIQELAPQFEKTSGRKLALVFANSAELKARIEKGAGFDVAVMTAPMLASLVDSGHLSASSRSDIARTGVGMAIHPLATKPDISTLDTLKGALILARSITYVEQGATAPVMRSIFAKLGLTELMNAKTVYSESAADAVAAKQAELGFTQISEILNVPGAVLAAPLPADVQVYTTFAAAASPTARSGAPEFIAFLTSAQAAPVIREKGMELLSSNRLPPIPANQMTPAQLEAVAAFKTARGAEVSGPFHPLLRSPELMTRTRAMGDYLRFKSALPPRLSEFVILLTAREWDQPYEWNAHYPIAIKAGVSAATLSAIAAGRNPESMTSDEAILYDFVRELHHTKAVSDAIYDRALKAFGDQAVMDTIGISGYYSLLAMVLNTARTPPGGANAPPLAPRKQ
jgi:ABC-type molybdate transport system substrate-binding protein/alkylhydroperoxidase family enzyme